MCLLAAALFLLPGAQTAEAQTKVKLVSNTGQTSWGDGDITFARTDTSFTTGSNAAGYVLQHLDLVAKREDPGTFAATIREGSRAGTLIGTLQNPSLSSSFETVRFTAGTTYTLKANTLYWVLLFGAGVNVDATQNDAEDTGAAAGWSIGNTGRMSGTEKDGASIKMAVYGYGRATPTVANAIPNRSAMMGTAFSYTFPADTFAIAPSGETLTYSATKSDGTALPSWLTFTAGTRTFSGTPQGTDVGGVVKVTAKYGIDSVSDTFDIYVKTSNTAPTVANAIPDRYAATGTASATPSRPTPSRTWTSSTPWPTARRSPTARRCRRG